MSNSVAGTRETGIGKPLIRAEDERFLTGRGKYVDDFNFENQAYGVTLLSPYAHARIVSIDTSQAREAPGVLCVLTGDDVQQERLGGMPPLFMPEDAGGPKGYRTYRPLLALDKVRCVGDRVAFIVAETIAQARDAADLIEVDYEPLDAVVDLDDAVAPDAPLVWDAAPGNKCCAVAYGDESQTDQAFASAPHKVSLRLVSNRLSANSIEPRACIGLFDATDGFYTLYTSSQNPHGARTMLCGSVFSIPESSMRVIAPDVGGGFGMKADPYPEDGLVLWAARRCNRPVKWAATRSEALQGDNHGRDQVVRAEMALSNEGKIEGIRIRSMHGFGAYVVSAAVAPLNFAMRFIPSVYEVKAFHAVNLGVFTNASPTGPYRGAGRPEATYVIERLLDEAAAQLGLSPYEIRRRNLIQPEQMPYATHTGFVYDSGDFPRMLATCIERSDEAGYESRKALSAKKGLLRGRGMAMFIEQGGIFNDQMTIRFSPAGDITILSGLHSHGQSHATVFPQLVSAWLGVPYDAIRYVQGDTDKVAFGRGTYAARSSMLGGCGLRLAADQIIDKVRPVAAFMLGVKGEDLHFERGVYQTGDGSKQVALRDAAKAFFVKAGPLSQFGVGLEATGTWSADKPNFPNGCHLCEVEVDPETGTIRIDRYHAVDDAGFIFNPLICEGQAHGALAQGLGQALLEQVVYDRESGQLVSGSFMDYCMPRAADMPSFDVCLLEIPSTTNPLGVKGVAESGTIAAPPTIVNAVLNALRPLGVGHIDMPLTPLKVWTAIQSARKSAA